MAVTVPVTATGAVPLADGLMATGHVPVPVPFVLVPVPTSRPVAVVLVPVPALMAPVGTVAVAAYGAGPAGLLRRIRGLLCGGHRPIIARTTEAPCSPRQK